MKIKKVIKMFKFVLTFAVVVIASASAFPQGASKTISATSINVNGEEKTEVHVDGKKVYSDSKDGLETRFGEEGTSVDSRFGE